MLKHCSRLLLFNFIIMMIIQDSSLTKSEISNGNWGLSSQFSELEPRQTMKRDLPNLFQSFLTDLTAKPYAGEQPRKQTTLNDVVKTLIALGCGVSLSSVVLSQSGLYLVLVPIGWSFTIYGSRKLRLTIMHACSHHAVFANRRKLNTWLGESISILTLTLNFKAYQRSHIKTHHSQKLLTPGDETYEFLINTVGFKLGMTVDEAWKHLRKTIFSPIFHIRQFGSRLATTFISKSLQHNLLSFAFWSSILGVVTLTNSWLAFLIVWIIPISVFFEASSLLRQCVEHSFPTTDERSPKVLNQMTTAIFCGEPTPKLNASVSWFKKFLLWTRWWLRMFFYHLPSRVLILTGDSAGGHDWHHRNPGSREWVNCIFERQREVDAGVEYYHSWGLLEAINRTFLSLSQMSQNSESH